MIAPERFLRFIEFDQMYSEVRINIQQQGVYLASNNACETTASGVMQYQNLGDSDFTIPTLSFGTSTFSGEGIFQPGETLPTFTLTVQLKRLSEQHYKNGEIRRSLPSK